MFFFNGAPSLRVSHRIKLRAMSPPIAPLLKEKYLYFQSLKNIKAFYRV